MTKLILGIDDAGRGPLIGPMILAGVLITKEQESILKEQGINDSKQLTHSSRVRMEKIIKENSEKFEVVQSSPEEIDHAVLKGANLNNLEAQKAGEIVNALNGGSPIEVIIDCPSINTESWKSALLNFIDHPDNLNIKCEHKADANHISAAAGSILAKVCRENEITILKQKYGDFGSGYPSDPKTKKFLKEKSNELKSSGLFRKSWSTWKKMYPEKGQATLGKF